MDEVSRTTRFSEVAFHEAAARHVRVNLLIKPVHEQDPRQLSSRFLSIQDPDQLVIAAPAKDNGQKVFLPTGWAVGLGFAVGNLFMQAQSVVLGQCLFATRPGRRVDAILVEMPDKVASITCRQEIRYEIENPHLTSVTVWKESELTQHSQIISREGRVMNWSKSGLGVRTSTEIPFEDGTASVLRVEGLGDRTCRFFRAVFHHCSPDGQQGWIAGFGQIEEIIPGQCYPLIERISQAD